MSNTKVVTGEIRMSYTNLFVPKAVVEGQEAKYSLSVLIPKSDKKTIAKVMAAIEAAKEEGKAKWGGKIPPNLKLPLRDGDIERPDDAAYAGHMFFNANSKQKPQVVDRQCQEIVDATEVYSGCYGRVSVNFYAFSASGNRGIAAGLQNVQKTRDGESLGGRSRAEEDFEPIEADEAGLLD